MKIAILVSKKYSKEYYIDDKILCDALIKEGFNTKIIAWDDTEEVKKYNIGIIRSCWDYHNRKDEFISCLNQYSKFMKLFNPLSIIKWNSDKTYLLDLSDSLKIIKTKIASNIMDLTSILENFNEDYLVLKPNISASGMDTYKVKSNNQDKIFEIANSIFKANKKVLVQKYISNIEKVGERSLIVIDGECTSAYKKMPAKGNFLVHDHWGGSITETAITDNDKIIVKNILKIIYDRFKEYPLYMRIDLLYEEDEPLLLELELIEPGLNIYEVSNSLKLFIQGIKKRLS